MSDTHEAFIRAVVARVCGGVGLRGQGASDFRLRVAGSAIYTPTTVRARACSYTDRLAARYTPFYTRAGGLLVPRSRISRHAFIAANVWAGGLLFRALRSVVSPIVRRAHCSGPQCASRCFVTLFLSLASYCFPVALLARNAGRACA